MTAEQQERMVHRPRRTTDLSAVGGDSETATGIYRRSGLACNTVQSGFRWKRLRGQSHLAPQSSWRIAPQLLGYFIAGPLSVNGQSLRNDAHVVLRYNSSHKFRVPSTSRLQSMADTPQVVCMAWKAQYHYYVRGCELDVLTSGELFSNLRGPRRTAPPAI